MSDELESIDRQETEQREILARLQADIAGHRGKLQVALDRIKLVSLSALGLGDAKAKLELQQAETETVLQAQRSISYSTAVNQVNDKLAELERQRAAIIKRQHIEAHEAAKLDLVAVAGAFGEQVMALRESLAAYRDGHREIIATAQRANIDIAQYNRLPDLLGDWLNSRLFAVRPAKHLDRDFGDLIEDFFAHRGGQDDDESDDERKAS